MTAASSRRMVSDSSRSRPSYYITQRRPVAMLSSLRRTTVLLGLIVLAAVAGVHAATRNSLAGFDSEAIVPLRTHNIYAPYVESSLQNKYWDYGADAIVDTNRHVRLTQDKPHQTGWLWSRLPLTVPSFQTEFEFSIDGKGHTTFGDGMAFWLTQDRATVGPVFGSKDFFTGLGIFFDTYANIRHPYAFPRIMAMLGNGIESYRGDKDGANQELGGCSLDIRRTKVSTRARLTFVKNVYLELELQHQEWDEWESCFKIEDVKLPENPYMGFSALTGDVSDAHDLISVTTNSIVFGKRTFAQLAAERKKHFPKDGSKPKKGSTRRIGDGERSGLRSLGHTIKSFFTGLFGFLFFFVKWGIVVAGLAGLVIAGLRWRKSRDAKRF